MIEEPDIESSFSTIPTPESRKKMTLALELGDIVEITAPSNTELDTQVWAITYIDDEKIDMVHTTTFLTHTLEITETGVSDESIQQIAILCRCKEKGYARQHHLDVGTWVDIHFGGEAPTILTGEITNLEEDMIEITTFPERAVIYIDFEYKGLPLHLPIEKIVLRDRPESLGKPSLTSQSVDESGEIGEEAYHEYTDTGEARIYIPEDAQPAPTMKEVLRGLYLDANEFVEEEVEETTRIVEVPESERRYTLDAQMADMTDEFVSAVPAMERTPRVFQRIHNLIHKFRELRSQFSQFDDTGNVIGTKTSGVFHNPIIDRLEESDANIGWIMPVVKTVKDIHYDSDSEKVNQNDVVNVDTPAFLVRIQEIQKTYASNGDIGNALHYDTMIRGISEELNAVSAPIASTEILRKNAVVKTPIEAVVYNADNFHSTVIRNESDARKRFVIQRYGLGQSKIVSEMTRTGKKIYSRGNIVANDAMHIRSLLVFPESFIEYSRVRLPGTTLSDRAWLSAFTPDLSRILKPKTVIQTKYIADVFAEQPYDRLIESKLGRRERSSSEFQGVAESDERENTFIGNRSTIREYALDSDVAIDSATFHRFLSSVFPKKRAFLEYAKTHTRDAISILDAIRALEPFFLYSTDITFSQYKELRYFVKEAVKTYKSEMSKKEGAFGFYRNATFDIRVKENHLEHILDSDISLENEFRKCYRVKKSGGGTDSNSDELRSLEFQGVAESGGRSKSAIFGRDEVSYENPRIPSASRPEYFTNPTKMLPYTSPGELLNRIYTLDGGQLYLLLIQKMLLSLITPDKIINSVELAKMDDMTNMEKIRASDCFRRHLVKKYKTLDALRKDNNSEDVYYDTEYDDTPYDILKKYKDKKKEMLPELFFAFFREVLIEKHDCPENMATELAETILSGKKRVKEGYALLELRPNLPKDIDESTLTAKEKDQIANESNAYQRLQYYKRVNTHWVRDESVDETTFIDNNTLLCNLTRECIQTAPSKVCAPNDTAAMRMKAISANRMMKEFDHRLSISIEEVEKTLETELERLHISVIRRHVLASVLERKHNDYAVSLGKRVVAVETVESPYELLRRRIVSQGDFVKRQSDVVRFVETYTREPMLLQNENQHWLYCKDTNTKLFPLSIYTLARAFVNTNTYNETLDRLCSEIGILSSDGDNIIDKHTQYVLRPMDFVAEDGYDESGFRVVSNQIMERDFSEGLTDALSKENAKRMRVFESEEAQHAYNVFATIRNHIGVHKDSSEDVMEDFVLRITLEMMNDTSIVLTEKAYSKRMEKRAKDKPAVPYKVYRNQLLILCVGCSLAIATLTMIPSFKTKKTFPGCVQSFHGYPVDAGDEDVSGLKYVSCILFKSKSSIAPWDAIEPWSANILLKRMKELVGQQMMTRPDILQLCTIKREYLALHPDDIIPDQLNVRKWIHFMPPLVEFAVSKNLRGLGADFEGDLLRAIRDGSKSQYESIGIVKGNIVKHVYGIVELIKDVVAKKELLLTTSAKEPFMENACCNEDPRKIHPLSYFMDENVLIDNYAKKIVDMGGTLRRIQALAKPQIMFHAEDTFIRRGDIRSEIGESAIYRAFIHYCHFDRDIPIPPELELVCNEKPAVYERMDTLEVKIEKMKSNGKRFAKENLEHLMRLVNHKNIVQVFPHTDVSPILMFKDALEELDLHSSEIIESQMRELLWATLADYDPRVMVHEERDSTEALNRYIRSTNGRMFAKIAYFLNHHGNLSNTHYDAIQVFIHEIDHWKIKELRSPKDVVNPQFSGETQSRTKMDSATDTKTVFAVRQYILHSIENMVKVFPAMAKHFPKQSKVPKHWGLDPVHAGRLEEVLKTERTTLHTSISNPALAPLFEHIESRLRSIVYFVKQIPVFSPIVKDGVAFHSLYSKETVLLLLKYCWYSVLYEYVVATEDPDLLAIERKEQLRQRRTRMEADDIFGVDSDTEDVNDDANPLLEIQLEMGDMRKVKTDTGRMLVLFLTLDKETKDKTNMTYAEMKFKTQRKKDKEKKQMTDGFERMERDERKVEDMLKHFKIGRWNIGQQKGLFQYSSETYARQTELNTYLNADDEEGIVLTATTGNAVVEDDIDVDELERANAAEIDREYEAEANDIGGLDEDYTDGRYYDEDMEHDGDF